MASKAGGAGVDLGTDANFSFNAQTWIPVEATMKSGDTVHTKCSWTNDTGAPVSFGEFTADEMCFAYTMYYPRIQSNLWSWIVPASGAPYGMSCAEP